MLQTQSRLNAKDIKMTFQMGFETNESGLGDGVFPNVNGLFQSLGGAKTKI